MDKYVSVKLALHTGKQETLKIRKHMQNKCRKGSVSRTLLHEDVK